MIKNIKKIVLGILCIINVLLLNITCYCDTELVLIKTNQKQIFDIGEATDYFNLYKNIRKYISSTCEIIRINSENKENIMCLDDSYFLIDNNEKVKYDGIYMNKQGILYFAHRIGIETVIPLLEKGYDWIYKFE